MILDAFKRESKLMQKTAKLKDFSVVFVIGRFCWNN